MEFDWAVDDLSEPGPLPPTDGIRLHLESGARVIVRPSGTEPVVRVMVEGEDAAEVEALCAGLAADVERELA